jgi:hypothetical protein
VGALTTCALMKLLDHPAGCVDRPTCRLDREHLGHLRRRGRRTAVEPLRRPAEAGDPVPERMQTLQVRRGVELSPQGPLAQVVPLGEEPGPLVEVLDLLPAELVHQGLENRVGRQDRERGVPPPHPERTLHKLERCPSQHPPPRPRQAHVQPKSVGFALVAGARVHELAETGRDRRLIHGGAGAGQVRARLVRRGAENDPARRRRAARSKDGTVLHHRSPKPPRFWCSRGLGMNGPVGWQSSQRPSEGEMVKQRRRRTSRMVVASREGS